MANRRNTLQKEIILAALRDGPRRPTAGELYETIRERYPPISRSTVFRVLADQAEAGEILRLHLDGESDRYDGNPHPHHHIRCRRCGRVADVPWTDPPIPEDTAGYKVMDVTLHYSGLCPQCQRASLSAKESRSSNLNSAHS